MFHDLQLLQRRFSSKSDIRTTQDSRKEGCKNTYNDLICHLISWEMKGLEELMDKLLKPCICSGQEYDFDLDKEQKLGPLSFITNRIKRRFVLKEALIQLSCFKSILFALQL